jgi:simple sugar transport system ATP-binding protein
MVFQHFSLFDELTVAENVAVALPGSLDRVRSRLVEVSRGYGLELEPDRPVWTLSAGERQRIEIVRCLLQSPKLLILDEPTSVLTPQEAEHLFTTLDRSRPKAARSSTSRTSWKRCGACASAPRFCVAGGVVATIDPRQRSARRFAALMVGASVARCGRAARSGAARGAARSGLTRRRGPARQGPAGSSLRSGRRDRRHRGRRRQRAERALRGAFGERLEPAAGRSSDRETPAAAGSTGAPPRRGFVPEERLGHVAPPDPSP